MEVIRGDSKGDGHECFPISHRSRERGYVKQLAALDLSLDASWAVRIDVDDRAMCFPREQLHVDFWFLEKGFCQNWLNFICSDRRIRSATGFAVSYQCVTQNNNLSNKRMVTYANLKVGWSGIEEPTECNAELSSVFLFKRSKLRTLGRVIGLSHASN